jgi:hypothetical protein
MSVQCTYMSDCDAKGTTMPRRIGSAIAAFALLMLTTQRPLHAQESSTSSGLSIQLTPYIWLSTVDTTAKYPVPGGGTATTTVSMGPGELISKLNFAAMLAGEMRYDRFSLLSDIMYLNASASSSQIESFDFGSTHIPVDRVVSESVGTRIESTVWTLAGGYTLAEGTWGNLDFIAGFRMLAANQTTNFGLSAPISRPDGSIALGRAGTLSGGRTIWNGIGGARGRVYLGDADWFGGGRIFVPFYFDIGAGGSNLTWQIFSGLGYQAGQVGVSIGYRYLSFQQGSNSVIQKLALGGPIILASFKF